MPSPASRPARASKPPSHGRLVGKVAIVTGAASGIGAACARLFAAEGAAVLCTDLDADAGAKLVEAITQAGGRAAFARHDVVEEAQWAEVMSLALSRFGALHVLHNNAGGSTNIDSTVIDAPIEEFWRVIKLDLFGTFLGCRFGIPAIIAAGGGSVINMASNVALMGIAGRDCYTAAKGGIAAITRSMAVEFAPSKVRVNAIAPAAVMTDRVRSRLEARVPRIVKMTEAMLLGPIEPEDIANMAVFLGSDESRMITGHVYPVDSGITMS